MMKRAISVLSVGCLMLAAAGSVKAGIIYEEDFATDPSVGDTLTWDAFDAPITPPTYSAPDADTAATTAESYQAGPLAGHTGFAQVLANTTGDPTPATERLTTTDAGFLGDWSSAYMPAQGREQLLSFDFYWDDTDDPLGGPLNTLQVYFAGNGFTWYYGISGVGSQTEGTWATYQVEFGSAAGWTDTGAGGNFLTDRTLVTEIGFRFGYNANTVNTFAFDNVRRGFAVPEPETYATIGFALVGLCIAFRRRLSEMFSVARSSMVA